MSITKGMGNWKSALHVTPGATPTRMLKNFSIPQIYWIFRLRRPCSHNQYTLQHWYKKFSIPQNHLQKFQYSVQKFEYTLGIFSIPSKLWRKFQYEFSVYPGIFDGHFSIPSIKMIPAKSSIIDQTFQYTQASLTEISVYPINSSIRIFCRDLWQNFSIPFDHWSVISLHPQNFQYTLK